MVTSFKSLCIFVPSLELIPLIADCASINSKVETTKLDAINSKNMLETQTEYPVVDIKDRDSVRPDYSIYEHRSDGLQGDLVAIGDAKTGAIIPYDSQAQGFLQIASTQTKSNAIVYYVSAGNNTTIDPRLLREASQNNVRIIVVEVD